MGVLGESISGWLLVQVFGLSPYMMERFQRVLDSHARHSKSMYFFGKVVSWGNYVANQCGAVVLLLCGGYLAIKGYATVGSVVALIVSFSNFSDYVTGLVLLRL